MTSLEEDDAWMMPIEAFKWIESNIEFGKTILEFGSGKGTKRLSQNYEVYSVEHNVEWLGFAESNYIYAPIILDENPIESNEIGWYDPSPIREQIPKNISLIIIDGPPANIGRSGILNHLDFIKKCDYILIDDMHRPREYELSQKLATLCSLKCSHLGKSHTTKGVKRTFAVLERK